MPHTSRRVGNVTVEARNDVQVQVLDGLPRRRTAVETDVVAIGAELDVQVALDDVEELEDGELLFAGRVEPLREHTARNDQRVAVGDREEVTEGEGERVLRDP